jgi:hypothetical protein
LSSVFLRSLPLAIAIPLFAQRDTGELRLTVRDPAGASLEARIELASQVNQFSRAAVTNSAGLYIARRLPFGLYHLRVSRDGFASHAEVVEVRSAIPQELRITLGVAPVETSLTVTEADTLLDPHRTGSAYTIGRDSLREKPGGPPGRSVLESVNEQPGWLLEANGVLHPRGSEYSTQYVIDGIPITDNRSPGFAPGLDVVDLQSMTVLTGNYPAEYGRKLGGVVEVTSARPAASGVHNRAVIQGGSFFTQAGQAGTQFSRGGTSLALGIDGARTDRYLDPPVEENFTNTATTAGLSTRFEHDLNPQDRLRVYLHTRRSAFLVPNDEEQQEAGQRQDRRNAETMGQFGWQHIFSASTLFDVRGMIRDLTARLWSNPLATPIAADQERGFREGYLGAHIGWHRSAHELKAGFETIHSGLRENFAYRITDPDDFDDDLPPRFRFDDRRRGHESAAYVQDLIRAGRWTFSAGLRWDRYSLLVTEYAWSPRLGVAWHWPSRGLVLRASYDRAFETPAGEGLLLASSPLTRSLTSETTGLPVRPSRGHFYQVGFSKSVSGKARIDATWFRRNIRDFADDDVFLNTGVSFPISFASAVIRGVEAKLEIPRWGPVSGFLSYSHLLGIGRLPITGGLFLEEDAAALLRSTDRFPISQDQRNTVRARLRSQLSPSTWIAAGGSYGSGLPIEREGGEEDINGGFSERILSRVNFERGRVRPNFSLDASLGQVLWSGEHESFRLQADFFNLTGRLNVINFTGLFSGTALSVPRSFSLRLQLDF